MDNTTIAIRRDLKEKIMEFATKKESYSDVIERLLKSAEQRLLNDVLFNEEGFISLDDFEKEVKRKWYKVEIIESLAEEIQKSLRVNRMRLLNY